MKVIRYRGNMPLFTWGVVTALALWWLYLLPAAADRLRQAKFEAPRPRPAGPETLSAPPPPAEPAEPVTITPAEPEVHSEDDLTQVYGIGPARAARLHEAGITTFAALAVADAEQLREILAGVPVSTADMSSWPEQASLAARGDWDGLSALKERLRAGKG